MRPDVHYRSCIESHHESRGLWIDAIDPAYYTVADGNGKRKRHAKQVSMWVATQDLPRSAAHPFYARLNQILDQQDFDGFVEGLCERFYAAEGRPGLPPGRYFRLVLIGYFEGLDAERAIAWRAADSFCPARVSRVGVGGGAARPFNDLADTPPDRSRDPRGRVHVDAATPRRCGAGEG
jgi:transposase